MDAELRDSRVLRVEANTKIEGVVIPTRLAFVLVVLFALLFVPPIVVYYQVIELQRMTLRAERETRILALHIQDVENVLIRQGVAKREDFAAWPEPKPTTGE